MRAVGVDAAEGKLGHRVFAAADSNSFSLHVAVRCAADDRKSLEQLCRNITRPALANEGVQTNAAGQVVLKLKTPWRDGTTHLVMSPLEFMPRLVTGLRLHPPRTASRLSISHTGCPVWVDSANFRARHSDVQQAFDACRHDKSLNNRFGDLASASGPRAAPAAS
jgi:hypothetical protein